MSKSTKHLLIGSAEAYSGKSATILGIGQQLIQQGLNIAYGKPLGIDGKDRDGGDNAPRLMQDDDVRFIAETLKLADFQIRPTVLSLTEQTIQGYMTNPDALDYRERLQQYLSAPAADITLLEGPGTLSEGQLFGLSLAQSADVLDAQVLLVVRYRSATVVESILDAKRQLGDRLLGILINDIPETEQDTVKTTLVPFLSTRGILTFGLLPSNEVLRSVSVGELVNQLNAEVLCCPDRMDLMVESLKIGAMNVNSALKYFRKAHNMAVVTGGDRTDLQLAALETSTHCLILTGHLPPMDTVRQRAEDLEIPVLSVDLDTLTTVEIIDQAFGQVRLHESIKVQCVHQLMADHFDIERFMATLGLEPAVPA